MTAVEFGLAYIGFEGFGKIKDIDFADELWCEEIGGGFTIQGIDFEDDLVYLGTLVEYPCGGECCGSYWEVDEYNLDQLASKDYLGKLIGMMDNVLTVKTGI
jgi:hypothetical protein